MYGTVAHLLVKPGKAASIHAMFQTMAAALDPGEIASYVLQPDNDPDRLILVAVFESKAAYIANAGRAETHTRFLELRSHLTDDPVWYDGAITQHIV